MNATKIIPVSKWNYSPAGVQGAMRVIQSLPVLEPVSGTGYVAQVHFQVLPGTAGQSSSINLVDLPGATPPFTRGLWDDYGNPIGATWLGKTVNVFARGDADENGLVDMGDATKVMRIILGLDQGAPSADANGDGVADMGDVTRIMRIILGLD